MILYQRKDGDCAPLCQPDPYIMKDGGTYYLYSTGGYCYSSKSLLSGWTFQGKCLDDRGQKSVWAPCVIKLDGRFYMYYSSVDAGLDGDHMQTMRVAVSDSPCGPFLEPRKILPPFSIDAHTVKTPGGLFLFYSTNSYSGPRIGTVIRCDRLSDPYTPEGHPVDVVVPTIDEEIFQRNRFRQGQDWHTIEGAFYFHHDQTHFLMYSGACYQNPTYFIGYAVAHGPEDADLRALEWRKYPSADVYQPLMRSSEKAEGVGHNSVICDGGRYYVVYHGRQAGAHEAPGEDLRLARIDEMRIDGDRLSVIIT